MHSILFFIFSDKLIFFYQDIFRQIDSINKGYIFVKKNKGLNLFFVSINIPIFCFTPSKILLQVLVLIKFSITTFGLYF